MVWASAVAARLDKASWPAGRARLVLGAWAVFTAVAFEQLTAPIVGFPGRLIPWLLMGMVLMTGVALRQVRCRTPGGMTGTPATASIPGGHPGWPEQIRPHVRN